MFINHFYKLCIYTIRECYVIFERWTDFFDIKMVDIRHIDDRMRISHGNSCYVISFSVYDKRLIDNFFLLGYDRNLFCCQDRRTHIYFYQRYFTIFDSEIQIFDAALGCDRDMFFVYDAVVISIFGNAADTVSTHSALRTIQIVHVHLTVGYI